MAAAFTVAALYRFVRLPEAAAWRAPLQDRLRDAGLCGTLLLAEEGINGTIAGPDAPLRRFVDQLQRDPRYRGRFADLDVKWSTAEAPPFRRARVRLKREIVTLGRPGVSPIDPEQTGEYLDPEQWDRLLEDPAVVVVDTRNDYEVQLGTFESAAGPAINPQTATFRQLPDAVARSLPPAEQNPRVAMFCTGGIRCEKSTAYLKSLGYREVYHLRGGILRYLEEVPEPRSRFRGACFVFDRRVAVTHGLRETDHELCFACGWPTTARDRQHPDHRPGISCHRCIDRHTPEQRARFAMRQQQSPPPPPPPPPLSAATDTTDAV